MLKISGLDQIENKLKGLQHRARNLNGTRKIPLPELLTFAFLAKCSRFRSVEEMFEASDFKIESPEDFEAIPDADWDQFIRSNTSFFSWETMLGEATKEWALRQLGF